MALCFAAADGGRVTGGNPPGGRGVDVGIRQQAVLVRMPVGVAVDLAGPVAAQLLQIQPGQVNALFRSGFQHAGIPAVRPVGQIGHPVKQGGMPVAVGDWTGIVAGGDGQHIFIGPAPELGQAVELHRAGVWHQNQLGALQHQDAGALGEFPVVADHGPHLKRALGGVQLGHEKVVAGGQVALGAKVAGVYFGIGEPPRPEAVEQHQGVAGLFSPGLQKGDADGHAQLPGQPAKGLHKGAVPGNRLLLPLGGGVLRDVVAVAPHLREQCQIRPHLPGPAAGLQPFVQIFLPAAPLASAAKMRWQAPP